MDKKEIAKALKEARNLSKKRKFSQSVDLIVKLKDLDLKKTENQVEFFISLPHNRGKKIKVCALIGPELMEEGKNMDHSIQVDKFAEIAKDKKAVKKLASEYDLFVAQANVMPKVASAFGRVFGPRGKMPNPKAGCVVPPKGALKPVYEKLQNTLKVSAKVTPLFMCSVGKEDQNEQELIDNILSIYNGLIHHLPKEKNNIKQMLLKLTMGKPVELN